MKAISFYQPFAWLLQNNIIQEDERTWYCSYKGMIAIHASKQVYLEIYASLSHQLPLPEISEVEKGGFVAVGYMDGTIKKNGSYYFQFKDIVPIEFTPYRGKPGLFDLENEVIDDLHFKYNKAINL